MFVDAMMSHCYLTCMHISMYRVGKFDGEVFVANLGKVGNEYRSAKRLLIASDTFIVLLWQIMDSLPNFPNIPPPNFPTIWYMVYLLGQVWISI